MPFAGYKDFADCVAKNSDKENPQAYCGKIKHDTEGECLSCKSRHQDFERIHIEFTDYYKSPEKGDREYYDWLHALRLDETKPYGSARESFKWAANMLRYLKEDADNKYYGIIVGLPIMSMNGNIYKERDLVAAALTLKGKHPSVNHKDDYWLSPVNPRNRWGTVTVVDAKYEDGAVEAILQVPKTATCPVCPKPNSKLTQLIDERHIVNVSLEGTMDGAFQFTDPPFTLLTSDVLPGIPLARIKPLERIMVEALHFNKTIGETRMKIVAKIKEDGSAEVQPEKTMMDPVAYGSPLDPKRTAVLTQPETIASISSDTIRTVEVPPLGSTKIPDSNTFMTSGNPEVGSNPIPAAVEANEPKRPYGMTKGATADTSVPKPDQSPTSPARTKAPTHAYNEQPEGAPSSFPATVNVASHSGSSTPTAAPTFSHHDKPPGSPSTWPNTRSLDSTVYGTAPHESLPSLEERRARIKAELEAKSSEEKAVAWEMKHNETYQKLAETTAQYNEQKSQFEAVKAEIAREREQTNSRVEALIAQSETYKLQYNNQCGENTKLKNQVNDLSENLKDTAIDRDKWRDRATASSVAATKANEDYLDMYKRCEDIEAKLKEAREKAKRIVRIRA